jgi:hypothetical protein
MLPCQCLYPQVLFFNTTLSGNLLLPGPAHSASSLVPAAKEQDGDVPQVSYGVPVCRDDLYPSPACLVIDYMFDTLQSRTEVCQSRCRAALLVQGQCSRMVLSVVCLLAARLLWAGQSMWRAPLQHS